MYGEKRGAAAITPSPVQWHVPQQHSTILLAVWDGQMKSLLKALFIEAAVGLPAEVPEAGAGIRQESAALLSLCDSAAGDRTALAI